MPRTSGSLNRRTAFAGRNLAALAREHTDDAIKILAAIGRGDIETANAKATKRPGRPKKAKGKKAKPEPIQEIPWAVRVVALVHLLDRAAGKPFQSVEIFDEKDVKIRFEDASDLRQKLIDQGMSPALLPPPPGRGMTIDADAVRAEVERDNQNIRQRRRG